MTRSLAACLAFVCSILLAPALGTSAGAPLVGQPSVGQPRVELSERALSFEGAVPGIIEGSSQGPTKASCTVADFTGIADRSGVSLQGGKESGITPVDGESVLRLGTGRLEDGLALTRWRHAFEVDEPSSLDLAWEFVTADAIESGDWFVIALDGRVLACGDAARLGLTDGTPTTGWRRLSHDLSVEDLSLAPGGHELEVAVGHGTGLDGESWIHVDDVKLVAAALPPTPCRPAPPEDVDEVVWPGSTSKRWVFDDNRFCSIGPGIDCQKAIPFGVINPNPGTDFIPSLGRSFEMYVVADCGTELHVPLDDVESGCINIFDENRDPIPFSVTNNFGFNATGGTSPTDQACWSATNCTGTGNPGGPGNERVMDVSFVGDPTLCGVFIVEFTSWAGCIWDLFANCSGNSAEQFDIYDDICAAQAAVNPLPELVVENLQLQDTGDCSVDYCVDVRNIGCDASDRSTLVVTNGTSVDRITVGGLGLGDVRTFCGTLEVTPDGPVTIVPVTATADAFDEVVECSEDPLASSCDPSAGGDEISDQVAVACPVEPICDIGFVSPGECTAAVRGATFIAIDGSGSHDPTGQQVTFDWTTDCPDATFDDPTSPTPTLIIREAGCFTCRATLIVTNESGFSAECDTAIEVIDSVPPVITCPQDVSFSCDDPAADISAWLDTATASDQCDARPDIQRQLVAMVPGCSQLTVAETWEFWAVDECGNESERCQATFTLFDDAPPAVIPPDDAVVACDDDVATLLADWVAQATAVDECDGDRPVVPVLIDEQPTCGGSVQTYQFVAEDDCGNAGEAQATFTIEDVVRPTLVGVPADETVQCVVQPPPNVTATDNCDPAPRVDLQEIRINGPCPDEFTIERTWAAVDHCGLTSSQTQVITVRDTVPPVLVGVPADDTLECGPVPPPLPVMATDNCDPAPRVDFQEIRIDGPCPDKFTVERTWTAVDRCGLTSSQTQVITVRDTVPPVLVGVPADATADCASVPPPPTVTATDNCDPAPRVDLLETRIDGPCPDSYTLERTWTAFDRCGRTSSQTQLISVSDTTPPVLSSAPPDETVSCDAIPAPAVLTATDDCDPNPTVDLDEQRLDGPCPDEYLLVRTWTATDRCGLSSTEMQAITVRDDVAPTLQGVPSDVTVSCDAVPTPPNVTATDDCDPAPRVDLQEVRIDGPCPDEYTLERTWTAFDRCGLTSSQTQVITVQDTADPVLQGVPSDVTVACDAVPTPPTVTATDDCDPAPRVDLQEVRIDGPCPDEYTLERTWTAFDRCGRTSSQTQLITVQDTADPVLQGVPSDVTVACDAVPTPPTVTATDDCDPAPQVDLVEVRIDGPCPDEYTLERTWTASDRCGRTSALTQVITVQDTADPVLQGVPADETVDCSAVPPAATVTATDDCDPAPGVTLDEVRTDGSCPDEYVLARTWTATDRCGRSSSATQTITVRDMQAPVLTGIPADDTVECDAVPDPEMVSAADNCDPSPQVVFMEVRTDGRCEDEYTLTRTWTATDRCGLSSMGVQVLSVVDTTPPQVLGLLRPIPAAAASSASSALPPASARAPRTACSSPTAGTFTVECAATDNCDPMPDVVARLLVTNTEITVPDGECVPRVDVVDVDCGQQLEIQLVAPPCPADPPRSPLEAVAVRSDGTLVVMGESVALETTATDRCGNTALVQFDPATDPSPDCEEARDAGLCDPPPGVAPPPECDRLLDDGTCCPALSPPPPADCRPPCGATSPTSA